MTSANHSVLIVDDGELEDVREILATLEVDFALLRGGAIPDKLAPPSRLFVATPRRALLAEQWPAARNGEPAPLRVGIVSEDSNTLRTMLLRSVVAFRANQSAIANPNVSTVGATQKGFTTLSLPLTLAIAGDMSSEFN